MKNRTHYEEMTVLRYSLRSCQTEWISSEKDHAAHMIRFHPEKVFDVEVQRTINEALLKIWSITRSKEVARLSELSQKRKGRVEHRYFIVQMASCAAKFVMDKLAKKPLTAPLNQRSGKGPDVDI